MSELRRDPITGRWVIFDTDHPNSPKDYEYEAHQWQGEEGCPFCYGNEHMTPPEIEAIRDASTRPNSAGWQVRVVPNKYPALQIEGNLDKQGIGIYDMSNGIGAHEVLIETPYHYKDISELSLNEIENFIKMYCRRAQDLVKDRRFKYIMIFKNFGKVAGASLEHPHSQIIALPMVPKNVAEEIRGAQNYFEYRERCIFCDILQQEKQDKDRIILEDKHFITFLPFVCRFPFEVWIVPKQHNAYFCHISSEETSSLAYMLKEIIIKLRRIFPGLCYNYIIHSSPVNGDAHLESYHWHIEFMPKLMRVAGFEWGTGFYVVPTPPEMAVKFLR